MKKLALNLLKSADEKIRSISKQPGSKPTTPSAPEPVQREGDNMAERRIQQRQGRRDRFRGNEGGRGDPSKAEVKRRSRSEGPTNRVSVQRQSVDEARQDDFASYGKKNEKIVGPIWAVTHSSTATRVSRYSPPLSDDGNIIQVQGHQRRLDGSDSESNDSDTKVWTKNPLVVRKTRKTGKPEKRQSSSENGFSTGIPVRNTNRDSFVYYGSQEKSDSGGGGGSLKGNKYQKLEEMRKKRIDIQMTSDEENTPESRISRLRQRAIQSGLGKQPVSRPESFRQSAVMPGSPTQNYSPKSQGAFFQSGSDPRSNYSHPAANSRPSVIQSSTYQSVNGIPSAYGSKQSSGQSKQNMIRPFDPKGFSDSGISSRNDAPANANRLSNQNEPRSPVLKTAVYSSSPESVIKRPFDRPRLPSVDSIYDGSNQQVDPLQSPGIDYSKKFGSGTTYQNVGHGFVFMRPASSGTMEIPKGDLVKAPNYPVQSNQGHRTNFNEVVELRLKSNRVIDQPVIQNVLSQQRRLRANIAANSDDSLDELIESNIQYLESEIESGRVKKGSAPVSRSASLPDPRRSSGLYSSSRPGPIHSGVLPTSYASAQQQRSTYTIPSQPHVKAGSELKFHIPVGGNQVHAPEIRIAKENRSNTGPQTGFVPPAQNQGYNANYNPYGAPPERKLSYDSRSATHVPSDFMRDSFSKSDTQLNTAPIMPNFREDVMHQVNTNQKSNSADQLVPGGPMIVENLNIPYLDRGMFSDVDYDIEVSERVNRWEKYMKKRNENDLDTIQERGEQDLLPRNIRRSVYVEENFEIPPSPVGPVSQSFTWSNLRTLKPSSSDPTIHLAADPHVIAQETNRLFQLIREPNTGGRYHTATSAVSTFYHAPVPQIATGGILTAAELREQMLAHKQPALQASRNGAPANAVRNIDGGNKMSRYVELDELRDAKSDSVKDLCRRFDLDYLEEDNSQLQKMSPSKRDQDTDWSKLISDLEDKIKETEVWSPNMESNQGDMVSIERVKARTLQTIPFSEDPFWKEIEEMTSFEKMFNGTGLDDPLTFKQQLDYPHNQSYTLPTQPRTSAKDRMHRSKSLYTPNITPLTISVDKYNAPSALDDVLDDIKTSLEKQSSPKIKKAGDSSDSLRSSPGPPYPELNVSSAGRPRTYTEPSGSFLGESRLTAPAANAPPQGLLTYATQQHSQAIPSMQEYPNVVNGNYQLDPNLLKQKLISTGLAEENTLSSSGRIRPKAPPPLIIPRTTAALFSLTQPEPLKSQPPLPHAAPSSEEKINQVNQSMEDLRQIAKDVETKINQIKSKLVKADENNLDKILLTLRKFAPAASPKYFEPHHDSFQDFYVKKKSKLSDALTELERIYWSLNLDDESLLDRADRRDYPSYRPQAPVVTERPERKIETSSISFQIPKLDRFGSSESARKPKADIDAISKSFQAILDEVNQTSAVMGDRNRTSSSVSTGQRAVNQPLHIGLSPEPGRKFMVPPVPHVSPNPYQQKQNVGVSPELQRKSAPVKTGIPRPVNLQVSSPEQSKKTITLVSTNTKLVPQEAQSVVKNPPLQKGASGKAFVPIPKKALDEPQRQNLQANVSKLMTQSGIPTHTQSVSIVLKSPGVHSTASSQTTTTVSSSQTNPPAVAPRDRRSRGRFRSKNPDLVEDDVAVRKARSKSTPRAETQSANIGPSPTSADYLNTRETTPPQSHLRLRPEKDADVMHDDLAYRSLRKDVTVETPKEPVTTSKVEFQIKQPSPVVKSEKIFEFSTDSKNVMKKSSPQESPKQRTVETQTSGDEPKKIIRSRQHGQLRNNATGTETTESKRKGAKFGRGVARMVEIFSSSDEERNRRTRPLHTRSAPDLTLDFDEDGDILDESRDNDVGSRTLSHVQTQKQVNGNTGTVDNTEPASDVSQPNSPSTKPPVHPLKKQTSSPDKTPVLGERFVKDMSQKSELDNIDKPLRTALVKRGKSAEREVESDSAAIDRPERPKSFHELLASFEPNSNRLQRLKSLRKCASEDTVMSETVVQKTYLSEPYHSEPDLTDGRRKAPSREEVRSWRLSVS